MEEAGGSGLQAISPLYVERGLFVLRYVSADEQKDWPQAEVLLPSADAGTVRQVCAPGATPGRLSGPGACVVLVAEAPGLVRIGLLPAKPGGSLHAIIKLERLDLNAPMTLDARAPVSMAADGFVRPEFSLVAHISRRGDVEIAAGEWAGGPGAPGAIEGLMIKPHAFEHASLEIQGLGLGASDWSIWSGSGVFVGTRGRSIPLVGLRARLTGFMAHQWVLVAEAVFLGAPVTQREGRQIELMGGFGSDLLVGLRLEVKSANVTVDRHEAVSFRREPRLKVFRSAGASR